DVGKYVVIEMDLRTVVDKHYAHFVPTRNEGNADCAFYSLARSECSSHDRIYLGIIRHINAFHIPNSRNHGSLEHSTFFSDFFRKQGAGHMWRETEFPPFFVIRV